MTTTAINTLRTLDTLGDLIEAITAAMIAAYVAGTIAGEAFYAWHADWVGQIRWAQPAAPQLLLPPAPEPVATTAAAVVELPNTVAGLRALARERGFHSKLWGSARKADLITLLS